MTDPGRVGAIVLAAGASRRFGGGKLLAPLNGEPILARVLRMAATVGFARTIVVLGHDADAIEAAIAWTGERRVRNPHPDAGLASSLRLGFDTLRDETEGVGNAACDAVVVLLGDQPLLDPAVLRALLAADTTPDRPVVLPTYVGGGGANPVLIRRAGWPIVAEVRGDRGLGPFLQTHPELTLEVAMPGSNPDVDTRADLAEVAWADRVRRNRAQVDRHREVPDGADFYGPVTALFRADPRRTDEPTLDRLRALARPGETWLDIGAGAGRYALPLALIVKEVVAVEPSDGMRTALSELALEYGIGNVRAIAQRWPPLPDSALAGIPADVALIAHIGYDIEAIGPFLDAMETAAQRLCVAVLMEQPPASLVDSFWPAIHGEPRVALPALPEFVELLRARGRTPDVQLDVRPSRRFDSLDELADFIRRQLWLAPGSIADMRLGELVAAAAIEVDGRWALATPAQAVGVVSWTPPAAPDSALEPDRV